jgi:hypothetical protein
MRFFGNLFLIMFLSDGVISVFDELLSVFSVSALSGLRYFISYAVILTAFPIYLCLGIDKRLPKRVFLPLILFLFWCPLATWFFPSLSGSRPYGLFASFAQVFLSVLPILHVRKMGGHNLLMTKAMFRSPFFSLRNTLLFGAANLFIIPFALLLTALSAANSYLENKTSGFMRIAPDGIYMTERAYRHGNKTIRLVGMIHVGEKEYYDDLVGSVSSGRTLVLAEGVTDKKKLLKNKFGYGKMAGFLGLTSQEKLKFNGRLIEEGKAEESRFERKDAGIDILGADVDISDFQPSTVNFLNTYGKYMNENASFAAALKDFNNWANKNVTPEMNKTLMDDILYLRNREVIRHLEIALSRYDTIVIPWGALHMAELEEWVLGRGFKLQKERRRISINFLKFLKNGFSSDVRQPVAQSAFSLFKKFALRYAIALHLLMGTRGV